VVVSKPKLEQFIKNKGYQIVSYSKTKKRWQHISEASRRTGISRPTIYALLETYPEPPSKTRPKYVKTFEQSEGFRLLKLTYKKEISPAEWGQTVRDCLLAWRHIGGTNNNKKDPVSWTIEDWRQIWNMKVFYSKEAGGAFRATCNKTKKNDV
jgi:predicted DNA-binding transcriptional regulator AlpA